MNLYGVPVVIDTSAVTRTWVFPKDRFIEYEPKDEPWCRTFGFGREETKPAAYQVGGKLVLHPQVYNELMRHTDVVVSR